MIVGVVISAVAVALLATIVLHSRNAPAAARTGTQVRHTTYADVDVDVDVTRLRVGDCLPRGIPLGRVWTVRVGSCHQPHRQEVYAVFHLVPGRSSGQKMVDRRSDADCQKRFKAFVGVDDDSPKWTTTP